MAVQKSSRPVSELQHIILRVNAHVSVHVSYRDIKTLLEINKLWNPDAKQILLSLVENDLITLHCHRINRNEWYPYLLLILF